MPAPTTPSFTPCGKDPPSQASNDNDTLSPDREDIPHPSKEASAGETQLLEQGLPPHPSKEESATSESREDTSHPSKEASAGEATQLLEQGLSPHPSKEESATAEFSTSEQEKLAHPSKEVSAGAAPPSAEQESVSQPSKEGYAVAVPSQATTTHPSKEESAAAAPRTLEKRTHIQPSKEANAGEKSKSSGRDSPARPAGGAETVVAHSVGRENNTGRGVNPSTPRKMTAGDQEPQPHLSRGTPVELLDSAQALLDPARVLHRTAVAHWGHVSTFFKTLMALPEIAFPTRIAISQTCAVLIVAGIINGVTGSDMVEGHRNALATTQQLMDILAFLEDKHHIPDERRPFYADTTRMVQAATRASEDTLAMMGQLYGRPLSPPERAIPTPEQCVMLDELHLVLVSDTEYNGEDTGHRPTVATPLPSARESRDELPSPADNDVPFIERDEGAPPPHRTRCRMPQTRNVTSYTPSFAMRRVMRPNTCILMAHFTAVQQRKPRTGETYCGSSL